MAARSLLGLFRDINPHALAKKDRGKAATMSIRVDGAKKLQYGHQEVASGIAGAELLDQSDEDVEAVEGPGEGWEDWEEASAGESGEVESVQGESEQEYDSEEEISGEEVVLENHEEPSESGDSVAVPEEPKSDENAEESFEVAPEVKEPKPVVKPMPVEATRIFDDEDFKRIRKLRTQQAAMQMIGQTGTKRKVEEADLDSTEESESEPEFGDVVDPNRLLHGSKEKADKAARLESIRSGREERKFGSTRGKKQAGQSLTNKEKEKKNKAFMMTVHKREVYNKRKRTTKERTEIARKHGRRQKDPFRKR
jgi:protein SDA1